MATLTAQQIARAGLAPTYAAVAAGGDEFANPDGNIFAHVKNGSGGSLTVTIASQATAAPGLAVTDLSVTLADGADKMIGPFPMGTSAGFNDADGKVQLTYSTDTSVTIAILKL